MKTHLVIFSSAVALAALCGCGNDGGGDPFDAGNDPGMDGSTGCAIQANFTSIYGSLLNTATCNPDGICHGTGNPPNGGLNFKLGKDMTHTALLGNTVQPAATGTFPKRVVPMMPTQSFFYVKISEPSAPAGRMPLGGAPLPQCQIDAIREWITAGAPNN